MNITSVRVSDAISWIGKTFAIIKDRLLLWLLVGLLFLTCAIAVGAVNEFVKYLTKDSSVLSIIVAIGGSILMGAFMMILTVGMMNCVKTQTESETFSVGQLFAFTPLFGKFLILQSIVTLVTFLIIAVIGLLIYLSDTQFLIIYGLMQPRAAVVIPLALATILYFVFFGNGAVFAATLIAFDRVSPFEAFKLGLKAVKRNFFSLLISYTLFFLICLVIGFIAGFITAILAKFGVIGSIISLLLGLIVILFLISAAYSMTYQAYSDIFDENELY